ncbi:uncharacterized protein N7511_009748 [Penicillium nucicola]|uniref:uncharacterized protein n=1 Tax=Penicillium nucicola TaxID=1850975 RepID=UPI0025452F12|nr:uncharacterized protein N7511_009748 [Penicillium nucicola]KAJ5748052.1 hypothetical protein N7511_009748 [Penicillium nucicola]
MRSLFKKPSWATKATEGDDNEFYRRSEQTYSDIVAATRDAYRKPKTPELTATDDEFADDATPRKRCRLSQESQEESTVDDPTMTISPGADGEKIVLTEAQQLDCSPSNRSNNGKELRNQPFEGDIMRSEKVDSHPYPDREHETASSPPVRDPKITLTSETSSCESSKKVNDPETKTTQSGLSPKPSDDPTVQILISSKITNTKPLLVRRKMSQGLREVRLAWCNYQNFDPEIQPLIYLTWKGRRLFDVTTCRSLGVHAGRSHITSSMDEDSTTDYPDLRIHMEAVADSILPVSHRSPSSDDGKASTAAPTLEDDKGEPMKLVLRSPGLDDFKIKARAKTQISRLISAFRNKQNISMDQTISLQFDGDTLNPDDCLGDYDIDDLDLVDVQIK